MARIFKPTYAKMRAVKGPDGQPVLVEKIATSGKNKGNKINVRLREPVSGPNGKPRLVESKKWYIEYRTSDDRIQKVPGYSDKKATEQLAAQLEREAARKRTGLIDRYSEHHKKTLSEHLIDYEHQFQDSGASSKHIKTTIPRVRKTLQGCHFLYWSDLMPSKLQAFLARLRSEGVGVQTCNYYLKAIKGFCQWCVKDGRFSENPIAHVQGGNPNTDRRHDRRRLDPDELQTLLEVTREAPARYSMSGAERAMAYQFAVETGLRAGEIRSLTSESFDLDDDPPTVTVAAAYSKRRREDIQPLRSQFAALLRLFLANREPEALVFKLPEKTAKMLREDLAATRETWIGQAETTEDRKKRERSDFLAYRDHSGRVADFHALRHTFISNLAQGGVHPKDAQALARHSTITLTMDRYTHVARGKLAAALEALPDLRHDPDPQQAKATGTFDDTGRDMSSGMSEQGTSDRLRLAPDGITDDETHSDDNDRKSLGMAPDGTRSASVGTACQRMGAGGLEPPTSGLKGRCSTD